MSRAVDTIQTKEGAVVISAEGVRSSMRSMRRNKSKAVQTPNALAVHLRANGKKIGEGIAELYNHIEKESPTFFAYFAKENASKNKFPNEIFLVDKTRVILTDGEDYYHASWVDGCAQDKQYILAQPPFSPPTEIDFFRMILQTKPSVIVALMKLEGTDDGKFILPAAGKPKTIGGITVKLEGQKKVDKFSTYNIAISKEKNDYKVTIFALDAWTDDLEIPKEEFFQFHNSLHKNSQLKHKEAQQLVICPNGAYRAGVWAAYDTEYERLKTKNRIRLSDTVKNVRWQRSNAFDHFELFDGLTNLLVTLAKTFTK